MSPSFCFDDYDCIGFDLDNTICHFNVPELMKLEYELLAHALVKKGYDPKHLLKPFETAADFILKGLTVDFERGNIVRLGSDGTIVKACHGTKLLTEDNIIKYYGPEKKWDCGISYAENPLIAWNTPLETKIRSCLDYFDSPSVYCFANCIDAVDSVYGPQTKYNVWPDILDCLVKMFTRENFANGEGGFFNQLKENIPKYYKKCDESVIEWLKLLKKKKTLFLITGSNVDFASFTATNSMGENWKDLFDAVIFYARKPGFFIDDRKFLGIEDLHETGPVTIEFANKPNLYSQGNWKEFHDLLSTLSQKNNPKFMYIGDNLIQDVYAPSKHQKFDTVALAEEVTVTEETDYEKDPYAATLSSKMWGSFFNINVDNGKRVPSIWMKMIKDYAKICIPSLSAVASNPIEQRYNTFSEDDDLSGFYPNVPASMK